MKNLSDKTKKRLTVTGLVSLCAVMLLLLITVTSGGGSLADDPNLQASATPNDVNVEDVSKEPADDPGDINVPAISQKDGAEADNDTVLNVDAENHVEVDLTDISKPEPPEPPNAEQNHEKPDTPASTNPPKSDPIPQQTNPPSSSSPKNGDKKDGMIYIDGFGWIKDEGGGTNEGTFDSDGDIDKQVGIMGGN